MKETPNRSNLFNKKLWEIVFVLLILIGGLSVRLLDLRDPPLDFAATRQLRSALIARGKYYQWAQNAPEWKRIIALRQGQHSMIEPTIMESLTAATYWVIGQEVVWIARMYSAVFWTLGGAALYLLVRDMVSREGALIALAYYVFNPFGIVASRSFQPDPLMSALIVVSWWTFYRWTEKSSWKWAILSGVSAGAAMLVKSTAVFYLLGGMAVQVLLISSFKQTLRNLQVWVIASLAGIPVLAYHLYGVFIVGTLGQQFQGRFFPDLLTTSDYYRRLINAVTSVAGHEVLFLAGLLGLFYFWKRKGLGFLAGIWAGYALYVVAFTYHSITHYYYHLPAIPLLAVSLAGLAELFFLSTRKYRLSRLLPYAIILVILIGNAGGYYLLQQDDYRNEPYFYHKVADFVPKDSKIVVLSQSYGNRIAYFGWISPRRWKSPPAEMTDDPYPEDLDQFAEYFEDLTEGFDYFIITRLRDFRNQEYLSNYLEDHYSIYKQGGGYLIFDLSSPTN